MPIPYTSLPSFSGLFLDYINNFELLKNFYEFDYRNYDDIRRCIDLKKDTYPTGKIFFRNDICDILNNQNTLFKSGDKTFDNIQLLSNHDTFAVVTGQQLGLLTGPFYTILKAINTIQLSEKLNQKFTDCKFVPVFWLEADDHDFPEINNINVISKENEIKNLSYFENGEKQEKYLKPAGNIVLDDFISSFTDELEASLNKTDYSEDLFNLIREAYKSGADMKTAFARFMNSLITDKGLIFMDPSDPEIKNLLKPVFRKELMNSPQTCEAVITTSVELEKNYQAQVKPKAINLFYIHEGNRYLLEPRDGEIYALKHSRQKFTGEELYNLLDSNPERFSWNVVTRPVCQDYILPTIAYVGGPSEIAYFGQFKEVYKLFGITMPVIYPRTSATILENRVKNFLEKNDLNFDELFDLKEVSKKLLKNDSEIDTEELFSGMADELRAIFYTYEKKLGKIDINQTASFTKRNLQFLDSLNIAKEKYVALQSKQNEVVSGQLKKALVNVYPDETLQERVFNIVYFLNKYGLELINKMYIETDVEEFSHQLIYPDNSPA
ncbi:MAG: bacillithiol biosynthesis cysteine-adding enzyme BshC [Ignavibacteria bacterium]|nr:bacillithiol biosynthesis cysteine-adding enzyme BshC [Ignavibacteria bacterium]